MDKFAQRQCVREVKELDLKSNGLCPRGFEPRRCRFFLLTLGREPQEYDIMEPETPSPAEPV